MSNSQSPSEQFSQLALRLFREDEAHYPALVKEILQIDILDAMGKAGLFRGKLVFKGGTALRLIHRSVRYSEDLDFSAPNNISDGDVAALERVLNQTIHQRYGLAIEFNAPPPRPDADWIIHHWRARVRVPVTIRPDVPSTHVVRLDVAVVPVTGPVRLSPVLSDLAPERQPLVAAMDRAELLDEKLVALTERTRIHWRDVFDIWHLRVVHGVEPDPARYRRKLEEHGIPEGWAREAIREKAQLMEDGDAEERYIGEKCRASSGRRMPTTFCRRSCARHFVKLP